MSHAKTAKPIGMSFGMWTRVGPRKHVLDGGAHWRQLANTIELSMCGGDAAFLSNYFDHLFLLRPNEECDTLRSTCLLCLFVCPCVLAYLKSHMSTLQEIFCMRYLWPGLDPALTTMQYFMHVRFRGYRHVFTHIVGQIQTQAIGE